MCIQRFMQRFTSKLCYKVRQHKNNNMKKSYNKMQQCEKQNPKILYLYHIIKSYMQKNFKDKVSCTRYYTFFQTYIIIHYENSHLMLFSKSIVVLKFPVCLYVTFWNFCHRCCYHFPENLVLRFGFLFLFSLSQYIKCFR